MIFSTKSLIPFPQKVNDYFYLIGTHYISTSKGYYASHSSNAYGFVSFDKTRCLYEKISKKEYFDKKHDFDFALLVATNIKERVQLTFNF